MLSFLRDKWHTARLQARYRRLMQERLLTLVEAPSPQAVSEDPGDWLLLGQGHRMTDIERTDARRRARDLVANNPHARNVLRLMEIYVTGAGLKLGAVVHDPSSTTADAANQVWTDFLHSNRRHFSFREHARRTWRDGECFLRFFSHGHDTPTVRFIDPEAIGETTAHAGTQGILTEPHDVETPVGYLRIDPASGELLEQIHAEDVLHTKIGVDSNQKRGLTWFASLIEPLTRFDGWLDTELVARKLQASIVLWRKVQGSPAQATALAEAAQTGSSLPEPGTGGSVRQERFRAGTILTTSSGTDLQYLQPGTNFGDAVPLGRLMLLCTAAGAGLPEFMLTADASNANYASTMVAEGPAVKLFEAEQRFFAGEWERLWVKVISAAVSRGELPPDILSQVHAEWTFPQLVSRDRNRDRLADVRLAESKILSRAEVARRDDADPEQMRAEIDGERRVESV